MHSVYHFYLVNQPNFVFIIFKISCSCALYSLHLECNLYPHLVIEIIIYILFRRYILISMIPILTNTNNTIKFTSRYSLITSPSTAIPERLPSKNIWEILSLIFSILAFTSFFVLRISISAKKTILAKLLHLLTGFIGEIQDQISISHHFLTTNLRHLRQIWHCFFHKIPIFSRTICTDKDSSIPNAFPVFLL